MTMNAELALSATRTKTTANGLLNISRGLIERYIDFNHANRIFKSHPTTAAIMTQLTGDVSTSVWAKSEIDRIQQESDPTLWQSLSMVGAALIFVSSGFSIVDGNAIIKHKKTPGVKIELTDSSLHLRPDPNTKPLQALGLMISGIGELLSTAKKVKLEQTANKLAEVEKRIANTMLAKRTEVAGRSPNEYRIIEEHEGGGFWNSKPETAVVQVVDQHEIQGEGFWNNKPYTIMPESTHDVEMVKFKGVYVPKDSISGGGGVWS